MSDHEIPILDDNKQVERFVLELTVSEGRVDDARIQHPLPERRVHRRLA